MRENSEDGAAGGGCGSRADTVEASDPVVEYDRLGGRDARCEDIDDVRRFMTGASDGAASARMLVCDNGRKNDTVLDLRKICRSVFSFSSPSVFWFFELQLPVLVRGKVLLAATEHNLK
jgi:hypothetical protein